MGLEDHVRVGAWVIVLSCLFPCPFHSVHALDSQCSLLMSYLIIEKGDKHISPTPLNGNCFLVSLADFTFG